MFSIKPVWSRICLIMCHTCLWWMLGSLSLHTSALQYPPNKNCFSQGTSRSIVPPVVRQVWWVDTCGLRQAGSSASKCFLLSETPHSHEKRLVMFFSWQPFRRLSPMDFHRDFTCGRSIHRGMGPWPSWIITKKFCVVRLLIWLKCTSWIFFPACCFCTISSLTARPRNVGTADLYVLSLQCWTFMNSECPWFITGVEAFAIWNICQSTGYMKKWIPLEMDVLIM